MPTSQRYFRPVPSSPVRENSSTKKDSQPSLFRHRVGRSGRRYLDRRMSPFTSTPLPPRTTKPNLPDSFTSIFSSIYPGFSLPVPPWSSFPHASFLSTEVPDTNGDTHEVDDELAKKLEERWKFDSDIAPSNIESDSRPVLDDFDFRYVCRFVTETSLTLLCRQSVHRHTLIKDREWLLMPDQSKAMPDSKINLTAHLLDALKVQKEHQMHQLQQAATNGTTIPATQPNASTAALQQLQLQRAAAAAVAATGSIRPPSIPQGMSPQGSLRSPQVALVQQALREKQQQAASSVQSSPSQSQPTIQTTPQSTGNGTPAPVPVAVPVPLPVNAANGTASPPKPTTNGTYHPSPVPSPLPPSAIVTPDIGSTVRVSTPLRKPTMPLQSGGNLQLNGFNHNLMSNTNPVASPYPGFQNGMQGLTAGMYNNLQGMKLISQHNQQQQQQLMPQYQQQYSQQQMTPQQMQQQQQHFQTQQQIHQQQLQQLQLMQLQQQAGGLVNQGMPTHFNETLAQNQHALMAAQQNAQSMQNMQSLHGQNVFQMGINPSMNNSALNMTVQSMNLSLGPQNMALRLPPNRAQQQQQNNIQRPNMPMGAEYGMNVMHGANPMMQGLGLGMNGNAQMAAAMSISRAPSTPLSMRTGGGLMTNGGMLMSRAQSTAPMQSPMMRPTSASSMHSNMGMPIQQPGPSLPVSLQGSPANMAQHPPTPHLRQQTVPGS